MPEEEEGTTGQEESKAFKVSDRRFSVRGYEEEEEPSEEEKESPAPPREAPAERASEPPPAEESALPPPEPAAEEEADRRFEMLVAILQGNALAAMGLHPQTGERVGQADPRSSRMFVDMIGLVKEKMEGNLTPEEEKLLDQVLSDLKMIFVQQVGIG